jgi:uncharacterized protein YjbI with pentapeptide repeats
MTIRSWLELLVVPLALVVIGFLFSAQQDARQQRIENQRAEAERELAVQRAQDEALQAYLDQMSQLILERKLLEAEPGDPVHTLAQARTSTVILRLDAEHNESVTRFLSNSGLAVRSDPGLVAVGPTGQLVVPSAASTRLLSRIALPHAPLSGANLYAADLSTADLSGAVLTEAQLYGAYLKNTFLSGANLSGANLSDADLPGAVLEGANLSDASLGFANLRNARLRNANLSGAYLGEANLSGANLPGAVLEGANVTDKQLDQARSLDGATMPNGQKYEDWLKDREQHREEAGEKE